MRVQRAVLSCTWESLVFIQFFKGGLKNNTKVREKYIDKNCKQQFVPTGFSSVAYYFATNVMFSILEGTYI